MMENQHLGNDLRTKAQANAKPLHASGRSIAFSIETVAVVLMLFVMLAVVVQFFGAAFVQTRQAHGTMQAATTARQIAEEFQSSDSPGEFASRLHADYDASSNQVSGNVEYVAGCPVDVDVKIDAQPRSTGTMYHAVIKLSSDADPNLSYELASTHYVRGGE